MSKADFFLSRSLNEKVEGGLTELLRIESSGGLILYGNNQLAVAESSDSYIALVGEVYDETGSRLSTEELLNRYESGEINTANYIDGSFALLLIDRKSGEFSIWTDPMNSRKVFIGKQADLPRFYTTSLHRRPRTYKTLDPAAIGSYLANGVIYQHRTVFADIRILPSATVLQDTEIGVEEKKYWTYKIRKQSDERDRKVLIEELKAHLVRSVEIRARDRSHVLISISGGYDSAGIAGIMQQLGHEDVSCFSYIYGPAKRDSDAFVAGEMSRKSGYDHHIVQSYSGDLMTTIRTNGKYGEGMANFCDEIDIWNALNADFDRLSERVLFAGDMYYLPNVEPQTKEDCVAAINMNPASILRPYERFCNPESYVALKRSWAADYTKVVDRLPNYKKLKDLKDHLYVNYRTPHTLMVWREMTQMRHLPVVNPLLDRKLLDFIASLSTEMRDGKSLYIDALMEIAPHLFESRRARENRVKPDWAEEFIKHRPQIEDWLDTTQSELDRFFPINNIKALLDHHERNPFSLNDFIGRVGRSVKYRYRAANKVMSRFVPLPPKTIGTVLMLKRLLVLRSFLDND